MITRFDFKINIYIQLYNFNEIRIGQSFPERKIFKCCMYLFKRTKGLLQYETILFYIISKKKIKKKMSLWFKPVADISLLRNTVKPSMIFARLLII